MICVIVVLLALGVLMFSGAAQTDDRQQAGCGAALGAGFVGLAMWIVFVRYVWFGWIVP